MQGSEEVVGDVFLAVLQAREKDTPALGTFRYWLFGIARRRIADHLRSTYRTLRQEVRLDEDIQRRPSVEAPEEKFGAIEQKLWITSMLEALSPREREVVDLLLAGFTAKEIAEVLNIAPAAAYVALSRAMRRLRNRLAEQEGAMEGTNGEHTAG